MPAFFQTLPCLVIDKILDNFKKSTNKWRSVSPLLWTCRRWRAAILSYLCNTYEIHIRKDTVEHTFSGWPKGLESAISYSLSWIKALDLSVEFPIACSALGSHFELLNNLAFENASSLTITIKHYPNWLKTDQDVLDSEASTAVLLKYLAKAVSNVVDITLIDAYLRLEQQHLGRHIQLLNQLILPVARMAKRRLVFRINGDADVLDLSSLATGHNSLTHLELTGMTKLRSFGLIHKCAATLKRLHINGSAANSNYSGLFVDNRNRYVVYPNMAYLFICSSLEHQSELTYPRSFVPFPRLQKLDLSKCYPFGDNVLFRGNQLTMQSLNLALSPQLVTILYRNHTFAINSHPSLQQVVLMSQSNLLDQGSEEDLVGLVPNIIRHANKVTISKDWFIGYWLKSVDALSYRFGFVKYLNIRDGNMLFTDVLLLPKAFPNLSRLDILSIYLDIDLETLQNMSNTYEPLSTNLETLQIGQFYVRTASDAVVAILALAILYPNLKQLILPYIKRMEGFEQEWNKILAQEQYCQHAPRIQSITIMLSTF